MSQSIYTETKVPKRGASRVIIIIQPPLLKMDKYLHFHTVWCRSITMDKHFLFPKCCFSLRRHLASCTDLGKNPIPLSKGTLTSWHWHQKPSEKPVTSIILTPLPEMNCTRFTVCLLIPPFLNCCYLNKCTKRGYNVKLYFIAQIIQKSWSNCVSKRKIKVQVLWDAKERRNRCKVTGGQEKRDYRQFPEKEVHLNSVIWKQTQQEAIFIIF